jgi:hypothetical protein
MCLGQKDPLAPISAVKPWTVDTGSILPFNTDSSKGPSKALVASENLDITTIRKLISIIVNFLSNYYVPRWMTSSSKP